MAYPAIACRFIQPAGWQRQVMVAWKLPEGCRVEAAYCCERRVVEEGAGPVDRSREHERLDAAPWLPEGCEDCGKPRPVELTEFSVSSSMRTRWDTPSGQPEPGDMLWATDGLEHMGFARSGFHEPHDGCPECQPADAATAVEPGPMACTDVFYYQSDEDEAAGVPRRVATRWWHNCDGRHLVVVLPNGDRWDVDGRAGNCGMPEDRLHRCWVRQGDPEALTVHVSKDGFTCAAGAGSIAARDYHGFLRLEGGRSTLTAG